MFCPGIGHSSKGQSAILSERNAKRAGHRLGGCGHSGTTLPMHQTKSLNFSLQVWFVLFVQPDSASDSFGRAVMLSWRVSFYARLRGHCRRVQHLEEHDSDAAACSKRTKTAASSSGAPLLSVDCGSPAVIVFTGKRHFQCVCPAHNDIIVPVAIGCAV